MSLLEYDFFNHALIASLIIGICCGLIGTYIVSRRMVFISGGISHASFGGLGLAHYMGFDPMAGAAVAALLSGIGILRLSGRKGIKEDSLIGIFWSAGMAIGIVFIALSPGYTPNLMSYLFGNILTVTLRQILVSAVLCLAVILFFALCNRQLFYIAFDREYARTHNINIEAIETVAVLLISLSVVICMKLAGIILVISYLTIPPVIAGMIFPDFRKQLPASVAVSVIGSAGGLFIAALTDMPTGAVIVLTFFLLLLFVWGNKKIRIFRSRPHP